MTEQDACGFSHRGASQPLILPLAPSQCSLGHKCQGVPTCPRVCNRRNLVGSCSGHEEAIPGRDPLPEAAAGAGEQQQQRRGRLAAALPPNVFANPPQLRGLKPASGLLYNIKTKGVGGAIGEGGREGGKEKEGGRGPQPRSPRCSRWENIAGILARPCPSPSPSRELFLGTKPTPSAPRGASGTARGHREGVLTPPGGAGGAGDGWVWGGVRGLHEPFAASPAPRSERQEFRKPARGECQVGAVPQPSPCLFSRLAGASE